MNKTQRARRWGIWSALLIGVVGLALIGRATAQEEAPRPPVPIEDIPDGYMLIEEDILVPTDFYDQLDRGTWRTNFWPGGIVPFIFDGNVNSTQQGQMLAAMQLWENVANVDFRPRNGESNYVRIRNASGNSSNVGMEGGEQGIWIFNWDRPFVMAHELAHTLGIWHEQSRPDRDRYVQINWGNIQSGMENNFDRHDDAGLFPDDRYGLPDAQTYDFDSVMHYSRTAFSANGQPTITVKPPNEAWQARIGQRDHLSRLDILTVSFLYPEPNWRFLEPYRYCESDCPAQMGSFRAPYRSFRTAMENTPSGGTLYIQPGDWNDWTDTSTVGTYSRPITIKAPLGGVLLGARYFVPRGEQE